MGRSPCCEKVGVKKGPWSPGEDRKLLSYIEEHGQGSWRALPEKAGLQRCGKSCRLRWTNYLRPDIKRGKFTSQEEQTIIQLHALLGNRWSAIATHLPQRTDNEIKNYWNTHLKKRLVKMGIDPVTHKPKIETLLSAGGQSKKAATLSHMAQWESARLEAESRLARESELLHLQQQHHCLDNLNVSSVHHGFPPKTSPSWTTKPKEGSADQQKESPTSTATSSEDFPMVLMPCARLGVPEEGKNNEDIESCGIPTMVEFVASPSTSSETGLIREHEHDWFTSSIHEFTTTYMNCPTEEGGFRSHLLGDSLDRKFSSGGGESSCGSDYNYYNEDNKHYWNSILNLVDSSPPDSPPTF